MFHIENEQIVGEILASNFNTLKRISGREEKKKELDSLKEQEIDKKNEKDSTKVKGM